MNLEDEFYCQLAKSIQAWLWVETETYLLYAAIMDGANPHLVSVVFYNIESFEAKLELVNSCLALILARDSDEWRKWRSLLNKAKKLNANRNRIVHQPVKVGMSGGVESIEISPSYFDARALTKGQTSYKGPVIGRDYKPSLAQITEDHKVDLPRLCQFETNFKSFAQDLESFKEEIKPTLKSAHERARKASNKVSI